MNNRKRIRVLKAEVASLHAVVESTIGLVASSTELIKEIQQQVMLQPALVKPPDPDPWAVSYFQ